MSLRRGGPTPYLRLDLVVKVEQGRRVFALVGFGGGLSFRAAGERLGLSTTTAWRRYWFLLDWTLPTSEGRPAGPIPPQRGTRAIPNGRPCRPTRDHPELRQGSRRPAIRCRGDRRDGEPCRAFAVHGDVRCRMHCRDDPQAQPLREQVRRLRGKRRALAAINHRYGCVGA